MALLLVGCSDAFSMRPTIAATAAGQNLSVDRLALLVSTLKGVPTTLDATEYLANVWVDQVLLAQALVEGKPPTDSADIARVTWPSLTELRGSHWHDTLLNRRIPLDSAEADSAYAVGDIRIFQHILFKTTPVDSGRDRPEARRKAEQVLAQVRGGADFGALARRLSQDIGTKDSSGYLPPGPRGRFVVQFDTAAWSLAPGGMVGPVETPFGFHVIRRPPPREVRDRLLDVVRGREGAHLDSLYLDSLGILRRVRVASGAPATLRRVVSEPEAALHSTEVLATYDGGKLTAGELMLWVTVLGPGVRAQLQQATDSTVSDFIRTIAQNTLLIKEADSAGIVVEKEEWDVMTARYMAEIDTIQAAIGLGGSILDSLKQAPNPVQAAAAKVDGQWDNMMAGKARPRPMPPLLSVLLRERGQYKIYPSGLQRALEQAAELKRNRENPKGTAPPIPAAAPGGT
jgi:hypothetical protein